MSDGLLIACDFAVPRGATFIPLFATVPDAPLSEEKFKRYNRASDALRIGVQL